MNKKKGWANYSIFKGGRLFMKCDYLFFYLELSEILMLMLLIFYSRGFANSLIYVSLDKWLLIAF